MEVEIQSSNRFPAESFFFLLTFWEFYLVLYIIFISHHVRYIVYILYNVYIYIHTYIYIYEYVLLFLLLLYIDR